MRRLRMSDNQVRRLTMSSASSFLLEESLAGFRRLAGKLILGVQPSDNRQTSTDAGIIQLTADTTPHGRAL
jgi:hypothetical protein